MYVAEIFGLLFSMVKVINAFNVPKKGWDTFWAIFSDYKLIWSPLESRCGSAVKW
jgi:hypothetical protein